MLSKIPCKLWLWARLSMAVMSALAFHERVSAQEGVNFCQREDASFQRLLGAAIHPACGISVEPVYYGEVFTNARGGLSTNEATQYEGLLDLAMTFDLDAMHVPLPGRFYLLGQTTHGRGLTEDFVGDTQVVSNIDSFNNIMQVSEYWWEIGFLDEQLAVRLGKQDVNTEFLSMDLAADFLNASFGLSPSSGFSSYPNPSMAAVVMAQLATELKLKAGVWDGFSSGGNWGISGNEITFTFAELEHEYALSGGRLPGALDVGLLYISGGEAFGVSAPSAYGYYFQLEQTLFREHPGSQCDHQGFGAFISYFPRFANGPITFSVITKDVVIGFVYEGLLPNRDEDVLGAGVAWARIGGSANAEETAIELFYKAQVTPRISLQPDLQYIVKPSGVHRDALVCGLRFEASL